VASARWDPVVRTLAVVLAVLAFGLLGAGPATATIPTGNLLHNPGAEDSPPAASDADVAAPTGWQNSPGFTVMAYGRPNFPSTAVSGAIGGGANFFAGGPTGAPTSGGYQFIDLSGSAAEIDAGHVRASLSAYLGGAGNQNDSATVTASFNSDPGGDGNDLGSTLTVGPVTAADRNNQTTLLRRDASVNVPAGARSVGVSISPTRVDGTYNDGYADNVSFVLSDNTQSQPPPPGSGPPKVTSVKTLAPVVAGRTTVVSAQVDGTPQRLLWDLNGDGKADVGCPGNETTLGFRAPAGGASNRNITVQAIGASGRGPLLSVPIQVAAAPAHAKTAIDRRIAALLAKSPAVTTCGQEAGVPDLKNVLDEGVAQTI
jgi:hypothetical protein